jgi:hypothetical protein
MVVPPAGLALRLALGMAAERSAAGEPARPLWPPVPGHDDELRDRLDAMHAQGPPGRSRRYKKQAESLLKSCLMITSYRQSGANG